MESLINYTFRPLYLVKLKRASSITFYFTVFQYEIKSGFRRKPFAWIDNLLDMVVFESREMVLS